MEVFIVTRYLYCDESTDDCWNIGVYSSPKLAIKEIMKHIKDEYTSIEIDEDLDEFLTKDKRFENVKQKTWSYIKEIILNHENNEIYGFLSKYKYERMKIDT